MIRRETRMLLRHYLERGASKSALARQLGISRDTIHRWIRAGGLDRDLDTMPVRCGPRPVGPTKLDAYKAIIEARLAAYPELSAVRLLEEIRSAAIAIGSASTPSCGKPSTPHATPTAPRAGGGALVRRRRRPEARPLVDLSDFQPAELSDFGPALTAGRERLGVSRSAPVARALRADLLPGGIGLDRLADDGRPSLRRKNDGAHTAVSSHRTLV